MTGNTADSGARRAVAPVRGGRLAGLYARQMTGARTLFDRTLVERVQRDHHETDQKFRRRRIVSAIVLLAGATLLAISLNVAPTNKAFYPLTFGVALVWAIGAALSGKLHFGFAQGKNGLIRPILSPIVLGVLLAAVFVAGSLIVREIPPLHRVVESVLAHARYGSLPLVAVITAVNGVAEETFFRGALFAAIGVKYPVVISTAIYTLAMAATGNIMLVFAAITLGFVWGLQRRVTGGILASIITHVVWSLIMLFVLPPLFATS